MKLKLNENQKIQITKQINNKEITVLDACRLYHYSPQAIYAWIDKVESSQPFKKDIKAIIEANPQGQGETRKQWSSRIGINSIITYKYKPVRDN